MVNYVNMNFLCHFRILLIFLSYIFKYFGFSLCIFQKWKIGTSRMSKFSDSWPKHNGEWNGLDNYVLNTLMMCTQ